MDQHINTSSAPSPDVLWDLLGPMEREKVIVDGRDFFLDHPRDTKHLLDHPAVHSAFAKDEYMPYWTDLWPAAHAGQGDSPADMDARHRGAGDRLRPGLAGHRGHVDGAARHLLRLRRLRLRVAAANARLNGFSDFRCLQIDWRYPPDDLQVPVVLAADLVYEQRHLAPIAALIRKVLHPDGLCLLTDQDRIAPELIQQALRSEALHFTTELVRAGEPQGRRLRGTLYRITTAQKIA